MHDRNEHPKFFAALCAAVITIWLVSSVSLCIYFIFLESLTLVEAVASSLFLLFFGGTPVFVLGGLISFPIWWLCKRFYKIDRNIAAMIGAFTGAIIAAFVVFIIPTDFSGTTLGATHEGALTFIVITALGTVAGWNGYRVAWSGQRRKKTSRI